MFSIREILGLAVKLEKNGEAFYRGAVERFPEPVLSSVLRWLADEELRHMEWFMTRRDALKPETEEREIQEIGDELLREILGDQTFSLKEVDLATIHDRSRLLEVAIEFEKDTVLFYEMLHSMVEGMDTADRLLEIIREEQSHIESLQGLK